MSHQLVIRAGTVVDGTGTPPFAADVAIDDGRIAAVGDVDAKGADEVIDATGMLVAPGWVDVHSHYDGQATWDQELAPSAWHGVTTTVMGNCGVGFAPVAADRHDWLIDLMAGVEDIPSAVLAAGIPWGWETFPEHLDVLEQGSWTMDLGTQIAHGAVRGYVMGERGARNEPATADDIDKMRIIVREAIEAGALGFSTSRTLAHLAVDGEPVPGTFAAEDELFGIGEALRDAGAGVFEVAPLGSAGEDPDGTKREVEWMARLSTAIGRPVSFVLIQVDSAPTLWREILATSNAAIADGADLRAQVAGRPTGLLAGHQTSHNLLDVIPAYVELRDRPLPELLELLRDPAVRERILGWEPDAATRARLEGAYTKTFVMGTPPDYEPGPEKSIAAIAAREGRTPLEVAYDAMLEDDGRAMLLVPLLGYSDGSSEPVLEMINDPRSVLSLADGGAHLGIVCDASMPTYLLTHWTRDRTRGDRVPIETIVRKQCRETAELYGLFDRGLLAPGMLGDVNVIDYEALQLDNPIVRDDLPGGGRRLLQGAKGYVATIKRGVVTYRNGAPTGAYPGRLVRGAQAAPA
ncbi:MAG TPA: amidohydrolase family protein [Acidimicrobiia bacterium]|nr:amidohydrolase family protein [Acidimicrobiia bacterium]